jgi:anti-sigma factor RsiW
MWWYLGFMGDTASKLSAQELAELAALADGTLPPERRGPLEARVAASPELRELLERQRRAVAATRAAATEPAPASLRTNVERRVDDRVARRRRPWLVPGLAFGGAVAAVTAILLALVLTGAPSGPTVADAARLATSSPTGPAPARLHDSRSKLDERVDGVVFPDLARAYGWKPVGVRRDEVNGRAATVVYYEKGQSRIGYVILAGSALPSPSGSHAVKQGGVRYEALDVDGRPAVTWQRLGHTCVLTGATSRSELLTLASWRGGGTLRY